MNAKIIITRNIGTRFGLSSIFSTRAFATEVKTTKTEKTESGVLEYDDVPIFEKPKDNEAYVNRIRNKSRLRNHDRNILHEKRPYTESKEWYHDTVLYKRKMLGRYGLKSLEVPAGIAWPTKEQVEDFQEYEKVAYPLSLQENWKLIEEKKFAEQEEIRLRELDIDQKLQNMSKWRAEIQKKISDKEAVVKAARDKKERMIDEIRREYGLVLHPKSAKFQQILLEKQEAEKKKKKAIKKEGKAAKIMSLMNQQIQLANTAEPEKSTEDPSKDKSK